MEGWVEADLVFRSKTNSVDYLDKTEHTGLEEPTILRNASYSNKQKDNHQHQVVNRKGGKKRGYTNNITYSDSHTDIKKKNTDLHNCT